MSEYQPPALGERFTAKYVRVGPRIFVDPFQDDNFTYAPQHMRIVEEDHLAAEIARLAADPTQLDQLDAGIVLVNRSGQARPSGNSDTLGLPLEGHLTPARAITQVIFQAYHARNSG